MDRCLCIPVHLDHPVDDHEIEMPPKSKRTVKDEWDEEEIKPEPDVEDGDAVQEEAVKKDETVDELVRTGSNSSEYALTFTSYL